MKTLAELWAEKSTPTIKVRMDWHSGDGVFEVYTMCSRYMWGFIERAGADRVPFFTAKNTRTYELLKPEPPATRRVYQALFYRAEENRYHISGALFVSETDAGNDMCTARGSKFIRLIEPGFEVPSE